MTQTLQERNKTLLIKGFDVLFNQRDFAEAEKLWSPNYVQHSGHIPPGKEGLCSAETSYSIRRYTFPAGTHDANRPRCPQL